VSTVLLLLCLGATYRLAYLIVYEVGPFRLAERVRSWVNNRYGPKDWKTEGINCVLCTSFWLALPVACLALWGGAVGFVLLLWLGLAGLVLMGHSWLVRR
jgi:hypothetical protein